MKFRHPKEFSRALREFIRERDNHICQVCGMDLVGKRQPVHHIDAVKSNNHPDNLILVCTPCHAKIHFSGKPTDPVIMAFRSKLLE
jgi:5-methylcytosine-specific restriction endonuclease McrA